MSVRKAGPTLDADRQNARGYIAAGEPLPAVVPAGPDNPMGLYALYIGRLYAIHGTNANFGIGLRVSHGCVRLRNDGHQIPCSKTCRLVRACSSLTNR